MAQSSKITYFAALNLQIKMRIANGRKYSQIK